MIYDVKLSIIIPVYNCGKFLERCFDSISKQIFNDFEVIIVDDGSTDNSLDICKKYEAQDKRFRVFSIENHGSAFARNYGLKMAKGEYIGFVDADDYIDENMYSTLINTAQKEQADIVSCDMVYAFQNGKYVNKPTSFEGGVYDRKRIVAEFAKAYIRILTRRSKFLIM